MHRLPHVHVGVSVHGRSLVQLGRAEACDRPCYGRCRRGDASEARGGEVHDVLASAGEGFAAGLRGGMSRTVRFFGDFNDPESEVSRLLRERAHKQLLPERGTNPSVYYLV